MISKVSLLALVGLLFLASPALAQEPDKTTADKGGPGWSLLQDKGASLLGATIGVALVVMGGAAGIARIGSSAAESMARQPEAAGSINGSALVLAALIEGITLFAVIVCLLAVFYA